MPKRTYDGITFDSDEEAEFYMWLVEAKEHGIVERFEYHMQSYLLTKKKTYIEKIQLKTKVKEEKRTVFQPHIYTADFKIWFTGDCPFKIIKNINPEDDFVEVDVKGSFQKHGGARSFSINRKLVYDKYGIYIVEIQPKKLFLSTWCPYEASLSPKARTPRKAYLKALTIEQYKKDKNL